MQSRPVIDVLNGANLLAIEVSVGVWELLQFTNADLQGDGSWRLSGLLRGQFGTAQAGAVPGVMTGARVVLIDQSVVPLPLSVNERSLELTRHAGPRSELVGSQNFVSRGDAFAGTGWRPLSPVHLKAVPNGSVMTLSWIRRTRIDGDSWDVPDVPLGEAEEAYRVEIYEDGALALIIDVATPSATYTPVPGVTATEIRVAQLSGVYGKGVSAVLMV